MSKKTIAYCRVSTDKQMDGAGIDQQRASIIAYAMAHNITIDEWAIEHETGTTEEREVIQRLLAESKAEKVQAIIVDRVDRLGRTLLTCERLHAGFRAAAVEVVFANSSFGTGASGDLFRQIMGALAQYDRTSWLSRMSQCRKSAVARKGTSAGGRTVYGYVSIGDGRLAVDSATVGIVQRAFELADLGRSITEIAKQLNAEGFRSRKGTQLFPQQVKRILGRKEVYEGKTVLHKVQLEAGVRPSQPEIINMHVTQSRAVVESDTPRPQV
jgi:DNA invertase Pin-like site-specific DNA recombinase